MDPPRIDDPLARLAAELERLSDAQLKLTAATEELLMAGSMDGPVPDEALTQSRAAARASADASARVQTVADERSGRFTR